MQIQIQCSGHAPVVNDAERGCSRGSSQMTVQNSCHGAEPGDDTAVQRSAAVDDAAAWGRHPSPMPDRGNPAAWLLRTREAAASALWESARPVPGSISQLCHHGCRFRYDRAANKSGMAKAAAARPSWLLIARYFIRVRDVVFFVADRRLA